MATPDTGNYSFCGSPLWDSSLTWDTNDPDFTDCFHKTIFAWTPSVILFLLAPIEVRSYLMSVNRHTPWNLYNILKITLTIALIAISITGLIFNISSSSDLPDVDYITPVIFILSFLMSLVLLLLSQRYGVHTSYTQFFFYLLSVVCGAPILRNLVKKQNEEDKYDIVDPDLVDQNCILFGIQYGCVCLLFILNLFADKKPKIYDDKYAKLKNPSPQITASFFSKLTYIWSDKLLWRGFRNPLEPKDLWDVDPKITSRGVVPIFDRHYESSVADAKKSGKQHTIIPALFYTFGPMFFVGSALKIIQDILAMVSPQIMKLMIAYVESYAEGTGEHDSVWKGYFYGAVLLVATCLQSIILSQYFERMFVVGMNLRTAMISVIYRKALKMSGAAKKESTVGEIVNLMSVDVQRFMDLLPYLNMLWSAPLQIALCCYFIYVELREAMFAGLAVMILAIPLNGIVAGITRKFQIEQMKNKDERVKLMNEILNGVKVLKLYGWEESFMAQVLNIRDKEITVLKKTAYLGAIISFVWTSVPFIVALACFTTYIFMPNGDILSPEKAFVTLSYLNIMRMPMSVLPYMIIGLVQVGVSLKRINKYLNNEELSPEAVKNDKSVEDPIVISEGSFSWGKKEPTCLHDIDIRIKEGSLTAVVGSVGAGKSSLVSAFLGEMETLKGNVNVNGSVAFVPQQAWMQNATLESNILFGNPAEKGKYDKLISACALDSDLAILPGGDQTEIGEKGINLSGGQKQRVSLARAVYNDADIYLLDDPLSAVDSHVGKHIFENVISHEGVLKAKTRVLVTHGITYLPKTDYIIVLKNGRVSEQGTYTELLNQKGDFADFLLEYMAEENAELDDDAVEEIKHQLEETLGKEEFTKELQKQQSQARERKDSVLSDEDNVDPILAQELRKRKKTLSESGSANSTEMIPLVQRNKSVDESQRSKSGTPHRQMSVTASVTSNGSGAKNDQKKPPEQPAKDNKANIIEKEVVETGSVKFSVYTHYMKNVGVVGVSLIILMQVIYQASSIGTNYWLNVWTNSTLGNASDPYWRDVYLSVYGALGFSQALSTMILSVTTAICTLNASRLMHKTMLNRVMRSPMTFFDTTPVGRIVNRFAKDIDVCDNTLPINLRQWLSTFTNFLGTVILIMTVIPFFAIVIIPTAILFFVIQNIYVNTSRQLKRLESTSRSPIYSNFSETINGASTIRAFGLEQMFITESERLVDANQVCYYPSIIANRWLAIRLEFIGNIITFAAAIFTIMKPDAVDPSEVGLIISYALSITQVLNWLVRMTSDVETNIVAVERVKEYSKAISMEASWDDGDTPPSAWPEKGKVEFEKYAMRYREGLDLVIRDINCHINGGETVGIVGRTGAGKSSLTVALFRLVEAAEGKIMIDGRDVSKMGLHDLRKKLTIIPQDPVLFSGTLRINLDPFAMYSDEQVWNALELANLKDFVSGLEDGLQHEVSEGGQNVSVGQRQLICLARALLRKSKVLILDEATAAIDLETDDLIQTTIRKEFKGCTVLTIAHRLNTIMDYDRIMVLDKGEIREFATPQDLLKDTNSIFYGMAKDANLV